MLASPGSSWVTVRADVSLRRSQSEVLGLRDGKENLGAEVDDVVTVEGRHSQSCGRFDNLGMLTLIC